MERLLEIMAALRDPQSGCPWDLEQDFHSIVPYTLEEAYEVADAIEREAWDELRGELGDLLLQVVYHAQMAKEAGHFDFDAVAKTVSDKMVHRHPHVFGEATIADADAQTEAWEHAKAKERGKAGTLDGVARALPALTRAEKLQKRAARVGFDWDDPAQVRAKLTEEITEFEEARDPEHRFEEFGDVLFTLVNLGRHFGIDAEAALRQANAKFEHRFGAIEAHFSAKGRDLSDVGLDEMEEIWQQAKGKASRIL